MQLFHYSEDPNITVFEPHISKTSAIQDEPLVWAIDDWHSPMYCVPRDCPRACFWPGVQTTHADCEHWFHGLEPRFVMVLEASWIERIRATRLYRYVMPTASFSPRSDESGHFVSRITVLPDRVEPVGDLVEAILSAGVELRFANRLGPLWRRVSTATTLSFSGTRLKNAVGYPSQFRTSSEAGSD